MDDSHVLTVDERIARGDYPPDVVRKARRLQDVGPRHDKVSITLIVISFILFVLQGFTLVAPYWRGNRTGVLLYPAPRYYGLFAVRGLRFTTYLQTVKNACGAMGSLRFLTGCVTPICVQYEIKCRVAIRMMHIGYVVGFLYAHSTVMIFLCAYWTCLLTGRHLTWASATWKIAFVINVVCIVAFALLTEDLFDQLNEKAYYPDQELYFCFYGACFTTIVVMFMGVMASYLKSEVLALEEELQCLSDSEDHKAKNRADSQASK